MKRLHAHLRSGSTRRKGRVRALSHSRRLQFEPLESRCLLTVFTVVSSNDSGSGTLREAITIANAQADADEIRFSESLFANGPATILLTNGELVISGDVTINGPGSSLLTIDASGNDDTPTGIDGRGSRIFNISNNSSVLNVAINDLTLTGGDTFENGGAILNLENTNVSLCTFRDNNTASGNSGGGAIANLDGYLTISNCTFDGNAAGLQGRGGAILNLAGNVTVIGSTIANNSALVGGGISNFASMTINNTTISGNVADVRGGGVENVSGHFAADNCTIASNASLTSTNSGGGIYAGGDVTLNQTIVADNSHRSSSGQLVFEIADDIAGNVAARYSLIGVDSNVTIINDGGNIVGTDIDPVYPLLGFLSNNGGPTPTRPLLLGSPAINAGDPDFQAPLALDQRGAPFARVVGGRTDIGAYERQTVPGLSLIVDTLVDENDGDYSTGDLSLREAIYLANGNVGADTITFANALDGGTIALTLRELAISEALTIDATSLSSRPTVDAKLQSRVFNITASTGDFNISGLTLTGGRTTGDNFLNQNNQIFIGTTFSGGAVRSLTSGNLTLDRCTISGNGTTGYGASGGGVSAASDVTLINCTISANETAGTRAAGGGLLAAQITLINSTVSGNSTTGDRAYGGGIFASDVTVTNSTVSGNRTTGKYSDGGGIRSVFGTVTLTSSAVSGNTTAGQFARGGAIFAGVLAVNNSTVADNSTSGFGAVGGGFWVQDLFLRNSTVTGNSTSGAASPGGGAYVSALTIDDQPSNEVSIQNSIVAGNIVTASSDPDLRLPSSVGSLSVRYSLIGDNSGTTFAPTGRSVQDAQGNFIGMPGGALAITVTDAFGAGGGSLANNGGPTQTIALLPGSIAINNGNNALVVNPDQGDQRGLTFARISPLGGTVDLGAFELQNNAPVPSPIPIPAQQATVGIPFSFTFAADAFTDADGDPLVYSATLQGGSGLPAWLTFNPPMRTFSGTPANADLGAISIRVTADDGRGGTTFEDYALTVVRNPPPVITVPAQHLIHEGDVLNLAQLVSFSDDDASNIHQITIDWGDGTPNSPFSDAPSGPVVASHPYADDGTYTVKITVADPFNEPVRAEFSVQVLNVAPVVLAPHQDQTIFEGSAINFSDLATFTDLGFDNALNPTTPTTGDPLHESFTYDIDWGDGRNAILGAAVTNVNSATNPSSGTISGSHFYADDGTYTVKITVHDDNGDSSSAQFTVTVNNLPPIVTVPNGNQSIFEGDEVSFANLATFTDPGFDNPLNPTTPTTGDPLHESFTYDIDWGDGQNAILGAAATNFNSATNPSSGTISGSHFYGDDGTYIVKITVHDDNGDSSSAQFTVTVNNVPPIVATPNGNQTIFEGSTINFANLATFTDPGFDNPLNPTTPTTGDRLHESFTYDIDWGDGRNGILGAAVTNVNSATNPSSGTISGSHFYADDGTYTVKITVHDDNGDSSSAQFTVTVNNLPPIVAAPNGNQSIFEGDEVSFANLATFTDPGFDNPLNPTTPTTGDPLRESFTYDIDWGDGRNALLGAAVTNVNSATNPSSGTISGSHFYADDGTYVVKITVHDDNGGSNSAQFTVTVNNLPPIVTAPNGNRSIFEGDEVSFANLATFTDPGFDNPLNPTTPTTGDPLHETFTYDIDWGDGRDAVTNAVVADVNGSPMVSSSGSINGSHIYQDDGTYTVKITVRDDNGGSNSAQFTVTVTSVDPELKNVFVETSATGIVTIRGEISDAGVLDSFQLNVDWGDGEAVLPLTFSPGTTTFVVSHQYKSSREYKILVTLADDDGGTALFNTAATILESKTTTPSVPDLPEPTVRPQIEPPLPTTPPPIIVISLAGFGESDEGAGGDPIVPPPPSTPPAASVTPSQTALQKQLSIPRAVSQAELMDKVYALGDFELVSLVGFDMGDEPVPPKKPKTADVRRDEAVPMVNYKPMIEEPVVPDASWSPWALWSAVAGGTMWLSGTWWWRGRKRARYAK